MGRSLKELYGLDVNKEELRERLIVVVTKDPISITKMAMEMGVSSITLRSFFKGKKETQWTQLLHIQKWINKKEKELGIE